MITRETVEEILGGAAWPVAVPAGEGEVVGAVESVGAPSLVRGVVTVPPWPPGMSAWVLPQAYRDAVEIMADAGGAMWAGQIAVAMGMADGAAKREGLRSKGEGLRSKLKRLVERGWAAEEGPGLFTVTGQVAHDLAGGAADGGSKVFSPGGLLRRALLLVRFEGANPRRPRREEEPCDGTVRHGRHR